MTTRAFIVSAVVTAILALGPPRTHSQGNFQNLDFEAARIVLNPNLATTNALPGWSAFSGTNELASIPYNQFSIVPEVGLYGSNSFVVIGGNFDVLLSQDGSITQTGLVPDDAASLLFKGSWTSLTPVSVSLGGLNLSYTSISNTPEYTLYGADISMFAGQTASLKFFSASLSLYFIDDVLFSSQAIPEPSSLALLGFGAVLLAGHVFRRFRLAKGLPVIR